MIKSFYTNTNSNPIDELIKSNKLSWEQRLSFDIDSQYYNIEKFLSGVNTLNGLELSEIGLINDKRILHFQSYFGLDSLSFLRLGAKEVVGLDFSKSAIDYANMLANKMGLNALFLEDDLNDNQIKDVGDFDIVFCSYGALCWIPQIRKIAQKAYKYLKKGGYFYVIDFHPIVYTTGLLNDNKISYPLDNEFALVTEWEGTYASPNAPLTSKEYNWNHSISEIINSFSQNGFCIEFFNEHSTLPMEAFFNLFQNEEALFLSKFNSDEIKIPLSFSLKATKI